MNGSCLRTLLVTSTVLYFLSGCSKPELQDISPDTANGTSQGSPSTAGLTVSLAGDSKRLYAVSLNAGVWVSQGSTQPWEQLHNSPPRAYSIASDPTDVRHFFVGEREDDKSNASARHSGLWETTDGGSAWTYALDPVTLGCTKQAIPSVAFSKTGIVFAATSCGVAVRQKGSAKFALAPNTQVGAITAIAISPNATWARTTDRLLIGDSIGQLWEVKAFPDYAANAQGSTGDAFSLTATDSFAYFTCCSKSIPPNCPDPVNPGTYGSLNTLLIYNLEFDTWKLQPNLSSANDTPGLGCDGTGLGGSKFVHVFTGAQLLAGIPPLKAFFYSTAQEVYAATGFAKDGSATGWKKVLEAAGDNVHSDFWDFLLDFGSGQMWISNDGGVYERSPTVKKGAWLSRNEGLHTHHIHTLTLMGEGPPAPKLAYPTSDNEAWYTTLLSSPSAWHHSDTLGDVNWSAGDVANPHAGLVVRQPGNANGALAQDSAPYVVPVTARQDGGFDGPNSFHFIQTLSTENEPDSTLDAVMLTTLPLQYSPSDKVLVTVPGELGDAANSGKVVLLRNRHFETSSDINASKGTGWNLETDTPVGTTRFWVAGGHANPVYFAMATQRGSIKLFKKGGETRGKRQWLELNVQGKLSDATPYPVSGIVADPVLWKGPVFVNPYNADELFVLTSNGVQVTTTGGQSFASDVKLTALVTGSGSYQIGSAFSGGDTSGVRQANRSDRNAMGALSDMAFLRQDPSIAVASSPFTGLFYRKYNAWLDLNAYIPSPRTPISSVAVDSSTLYFATEGRGVFRLIGYSNGGT